MDTIILAGGKSSRMGQNKALMQVGGRRVIDRLIAEFEPVSKKIIVIANDVQTYKNLNVRVLEDEAAFRGQGPLAGIYTGLHTVGNGPCLIVACDMPFASAKRGCQLIDLLKKNDRDAVILRDSERIHPLFGAYNARIAEVAKAALEEGKRSVKALLDRIDAEYMIVDDGIRDIWNMNTMEDYIKAGELAKGSEKNDM